MVLIWWVLETRTPFCEGTVWDRFQPGNEDVIRLGSFILAYSSCVTTVLLDIFEHYQFYILLFSLSTVLIQVYHSASLKIDHLW